jgi:ABC-type glycerol-3-phosphate transport system substrate-binding protein
MKAILPLLCLLTLAACSGKPPTPTASAQPAAATSSRVATPWDAMKADEQRAKNVQKIVDKQAADQRKQIEAQTQ